MAICIFKNNNKNNPNKKTLKFILTKNDLRLNLRYYTVNTKTKLLFADMHYNALIMGEHWL